MALRGLEGEELVQNLRQLVISFEPHIRESGSSDQTEETLTHLEENDENFHRYEFVKQLKKKIEEVVGPEIEDEIEKQAVGGRVNNGQDTLVSNITHTIIKSKPYIDLTKKLKLNVEKSVNELLRNFDAEFGFGRHNDGGLPNRNEPLRLRQGSDEESSTDSSYNHGSLMFMTTEYLQQISEKLAKTKDIMTRREALQNVNTVRIDDVICSDLFVEIRKHILDALQDSDDQIVNLSLKFITRAFSSTSPHTKEIYSLLTEHLIGQFHTRKSTIPKVKNGLDISRPDVQKIFMAFRLMNQFQHETTSYWIRYPEMYLEEILVSTLNLLSIHHVGTMATSQQLSPLHFIALLDTRAQWFIKWMHGHFSRSFLLDLLEKYRPFVENAVKHCLEFSAARKVPFDLMSDISENISKSASESRRHYFTGSELEYAYFIHSACVVGKLLCFAKGRKFFPIKLKDSEEPVSIKKLMVAMVLIVVDPSPVFHLPKSNSEIYDPARLVADVLKGLCSSEQAAENCLFLDEITSTLISPISHFLDVADKSSSAGTAVKTPSNEESGAACSSDDKTANVPFNESTDKPSPGDKQVKSSSGNITTEQVSNDATEKPVSNDTTTKQVTNDSTAKSVSNDTTAKPVSNDTTAKSASNVETSKQDSNATTQITNDTTAKSVANDTTAKPVSNDTSEKSVSNVETSKQDSAKSVSIDTTTKQVTNDTTAKSVSNDTMAKPVSNDAGEKSVSNIETLKQDSNDTTAKQVTKDKTLEPVSHDTSAKPVSNDTTANPVSNDTTAKSVSFDTTAKLVTDDKTLNPDLKDTTAKPVSNDTTAKLVTDDKISKQISNDTTTKPFSNDETSNLDYRDTAIKSVSNEVTLNQISNNTTMKPVSNKETSKHISNNTTLKSVSNDEILKPVSNDMTTKSVCSDTTMKPVSNAKTSKSVSIDMTMKPVSNDKTSERVSNDIKMVKCHTNNKADEQQVYHTTDKCSSDNTPVQCSSNEDITKRAPEEEAIGTDSEAGMDHQAPGEKTLLHVADILSMIASSTKGRRHLIYGEHRDFFSRTKSSAAHIIAEFTKKALLRQLPREAGSPPSPAVIGAYLYICRQLYNTCEGLLVLYPYDLHSVVAEAWQEASRDVETCKTPTPGEEDSSSDNSSITIKEPYDLVQWEDTLRDNLLNFASTAKGILLLQNTGALNECMLYMHSRYEKKLQVSKCEKFGYGYMVTQVAATAPGMVALRKTDYLKALITELWSVIECGPKDVTLFTPRPWPVDPIDRTAHKHLGRLLNVVSAFPALYELLADTQLPTKASYGVREVPESLIGLIDRIVILNPAKIHSLFNVEQSHAFGLRVLSMMTSCLDSLLLLQSQYKIQESLLAAQADNQINKDQKEIIVDVLSMERNNILVRSYLIGGPTERVLPSRTLEDTGNPYPYPLFSSYPIPREYSPNLGGRSAMKQDNELTDFLDMKKGEKGRAWLEKCRTLLVKFLASKGDQVKGSVIQKLLEQGVKVCSSIPEESVFPMMQYTGTDSALKTVRISPLKQLGIKMAIRYGIHLKMVHTSADATDNLTLLIRQLTYFLQQQQKTPDTDMKYLKSGYPGFDWFAATVFLAFNGNHNKAWDFLQQFSSLGASAYLWLPRLHASVHLPAGLSASGIPPLFSSTGHNIEFILQIELPLISSAFKMSGFTPAQISLHWLSQCFWNYLDWLDVCHYVVLCLILGVDYQVYMCVAVLRHLHHDIAAHVQAQDLITFLKEEPITGFKVSQHIKYMQELEKKYRKMILPDMLNMTRP